MMNDLCVHVGGLVRQTARDLERLTFQIKPVPPFRLDLTVQARRRRAINAVDRWDGTTYRRILIMDGWQVGIEVVQIAPSERPMLQVTVSGSSLPPSARFAAMAALTRLLGVDRCLDDFYRAAADHPGLGRFPRPEAAALPDLVRDADQRVRLPAGHAQPGYPSPQPPGGSLHARFGGIGRSILLGRLSTIHPQPHDSPMDAIVTEAGLVKSPPWRAGPKPDSAAPLAWDEDLNGRGAYASPPCFMHELDPAYLGLQRDRDHAAADSTAGRKAARRGGIDAPDATMLRAARRK